jgi:FdhE protein
MPRSTAGVPTGVASRLADLERRRPEWRTWLRLLGEAERTLHDGAWDAHLSDGRVPEDAPLLQGRRLTVSGERTRRLVCRIASLAAAEGAGDAATLHRYRPSGAGAMQLLGYEVQQDRGGIGAIAAEWQVGAGALATVAGLAALPLLRSCGRLLQDQVPSQWSHGYCPICAGWPIIAELRGLDRTRRLRCGRCGCDWQMPWLCCAYCGEKDHRRLGFLVSDDPRDVLRVETCSHCNGYLKSIAVLRASPFFELHLTDLETLELDLVALDQGLARPVGAGFALDVQVVSRPSRPLSQFLRHG